ncbi:NAD(P)-binding protein [Aspergillus egyptiacus]|nr:NAD(P)-binding protein [Aspergillus egyptiacus]
MPSVFLLGPGLIGSHVLDQLLQEKSQSYQITTLVRRESARAGFHELGVQTVLGTLSDTSIITSQTAASDIVIHTATADDLPSVRAILDGVRQRSQRGQHTIYIHTSGASLLGDTAQGAYRTDVVFDDEKPEQIDALPDSASHREIDLAIVHARRELASMAKFAIMIPPVIYGVGAREKRLSIQLPTMVRFSIKHGYAGMIGEGRAVWSQIHVRDLARGYLTVLHWLERTPAEEVMRNPYFFCENGQELSWKECAAEIGRILHQAGKVPDPTPKTIPSQDYSDLFGEYSGLVIGSNSRSRASRLRRLGWVPCEKSTFASLAEDEIPLILQEKGEFNGYAAPVASGKFEA